MSYKFSSEDEILTKFVQQSRELFDGSHPKHKDIHIQNKQFGYTFQKKSVEQVRTNLLNKFILIK